jgi:amino acid transporter
MTQAAFSFIGTEIVAVRARSILCAIYSPNEIALFPQIAAGEAKNPRRNLPKAIKRVYIRILLFYIGGTAIIGLLVPSNEPDLNLTSHNAGSSPFVIAIQNAGIRGLPSVSFCLQPLVILLIFFEGYQRLSFDFSMVRRFK